MDRHELAIPPRPIHPAVLLIDADEARGQRIAGALTLADFHVYVANSPYQALERALREVMLPVVVVLGQGDWQNRTTDMVMRRLYNRFAERTAQPIPTLYLPTSSNPSDPRASSRPSYPPTSAPSLSPRLSYTNGPSWSDPSSAAQPLYPSPQPTPHPSQPPYLSAPNEPNQIDGFGRLPSLQTEASHLLEQIWRLAPSTLADPRPSAETLVNSHLPAYGLTPRYSQKLHVSNEYARQVIEAAYAVIGADHWASAMTDAGLGRLSQPHNWPPEDDERAIPVVAFSQLNAAVERSRPDAPAEQLRLWGEASAQTSLGRQAPSWVTQQAHKLLSHERALTLALNDFTARMNETRGEELHFWKPRGDGSYWLVHYSNLYAYGRSRRDEPSCFVWLATIGTALQHAQIEHVYEVSEVECGCQTLTSHCVFLIEPRQSHPN